jgi:hypothetical protein
MSRLDYVEAFIRGIHENLSPGIPETLAGIWISREGEGSLFLDQSDSGAYESTVDRLIDDFVKDDSLSRRSVESFLQEALFRALDINGTSSQTFDERIGPSQAALRKRLASPPSEFRCLVRVDGLAGKDLPFALGRVRFVEYGPSQERQLSRGSPPAGTRLLREQARDVLTGKVCAIADVEASDLASAQSRARREVRATLDCLNFFGDLTPYNHGWVHFPAEAAGVVETVPVRDSAGGVHVGFQHQGPTLPFSLEQLRKSRQVLRYVRIVGALLRTAKPGEAGQVLLTAFQWAGRASVEPRREQSFLLFTIALETAALPSQQQELNYRLGNRVASLLGRSRPQRDEIRHELVRLYKLRSSIVHSGSNEVTDVDLASVRSLAKRALLQLAGRRAMWSWTPAALDTWLESTSAK